MDEIFLLTFYHDFYGERETENYVHKSESGAQKHLQELKDYSINHLEITNDDKGFEENSENAVFYYGRTGSTFEINIENKTILE